MNAKLLKTIFMFWPPFIGAGIRVRYIAPDFSEAFIALPLRWYNRNISNVHFGGSLYSMTDPFFMLMLIHRLGKDYIVWDKSSSIDFIAPGRGTVTANFRLKNKQIAKIKEKTYKGDVYLPEFSVNIIDEQEDVIAKVIKTLYIRRKIEK